MLVISESLLIAKLHPQINSRLKLNTGYIISWHAHFKYIFELAKKKKNWNEID